MQLSVMRSEVSRLSESRAKIAGRSAVTALAGLFVARQGRISLLTTTLSPELILGVPSWPGRQANY